MPYPRTTCAKCDSVAVWVPEERPDTDPNISGRYCCTECGYEELV